MTAGVRIGVDVGTVRVGVAVSDAGGVLATPLTTLSRDAKRESDLDALAGLVAEHGAVEVVVGHPMGLSGEPGRSAAAASAYADALAGRVAPVPVRLVDERLTTAQAHQQLAAAGRTSRQRRNIVDQAAAVAILQTALDSAL